MTNVEKITLGNAVKEPLYVINVIKIGIMIRDVLLRSRMTIGKIGIKDRNSYLYKRWWKDPLRSRIKKKVPKPNVRIYAYTKGDAEAGCFKVVTASCHK